MQALRPISMSLIALLGACDPSHQMGAPKSTKTADNQPTAAGQPATSSSTTITIVPVATTEAPPAASAGIASSVAPPLPAAPAASAAAADASEYNFEDIDIPADPAKGAAPAGAAPRVGQLRGLYVSQSKTLERCYADATKGDKRPSPYRVGTLVSVKPSGQVASVTTNGEAPANLNQCLQTAIKGWSFPAGTQAYTVKRTLAFKPRLAGLTPPASSPASWRGGAEKAKNEPILLLSSPSPRSWRGGWGVRPRT